MLAALALACAAAGPLGAAGRAPVAAPPPDRFDVVVIDPGHGGEDRGAAGRSGLLEKDLVLDVARRVAKQLREAGIEVVMTRQSDETVGLEQRTSLANDARADLFLSIHANAARVSGAHGIETFFASLDASDEASRKLAELENQAFGEAASRAYVPDDPLVAILGDLIANEHLREAQDFASLAQNRMAEARLSRSRGVKQAPFVVLLGVQMPAALVEIGFLSNPDEERALRKGQRRQRIAQSLAKAVLEFRGRYDARRGTGEIAGGGN